ncbi:MAG: hypothetical protein U5J83_19370 [Bryobacterales bacterium]|nr:hypothetical protein [Bryobacterales bacterium]
MLGCFVWPPITREFSCVDPFGVTWKVVFLWHQVGISIRHADTDRLQVSSGGPRRKRIHKVIATPHVDLKESARLENREISDAWVIRLASAHLRLMIQSGEDMDKTLITVGLDDLRRSQEIMAG